MKKQLHLPQSSRLLLGLGLLFTCNALTGSLAQSAPAACEEQLTFTFWGSPQEKRAVEDMVVGFNEAHPEIQIRAQHVPTAYDEKMRTMIAGGTPPDVAYLGAADALQWLSEGAVLDLAAYYESDPAVQSQMPFTRFATGDGSGVAGVYTAPEIQILYYNKALFDEAGVAYPPANVADALTWDAFVELAKKMTRDRNGNDATSAEFDPSNIETYGFSFPTWWAGYLPFIYSNGGSLANEDGTELTLNQPEAVEVLQKMQDLIYVHHVSPTPTQAEAFPSADVMMQTGKVAMSMEGHWKVLDFSQLPNLEWGMGVLPVLQEPVTQMTSASTSIFSSTPCPEAAWEFVKWHNDPERVDLFRKGLWMPLQEEYYTDPAKIAEWLEGEEGVYPAEAEEVLTGPYTLEHSIVQPDATLKNAVQILSDAIDPAIGLLWNGELSAQEAADQAVEKATPLMQGRW